MKESTEDREAAADLACACGHTCEHGPHEMDFDHEPEGLPVPMLRAPCATVKPDDCICSLDCTGDPDLYPYCRACHELRRESADISASSVPVVGDRVPRRTERQGGDYELRARVVR